MAWNVDIDIQENASYIRHMFDVRQTNAFQIWRAKLRDPVVRKRIGARIDRLSFGNFGDVKSVGHGVHELRLDFGPGYRLYFVQRGGQVIILLCGGDKASQDKDIAAAKTMAIQIEEKPHDA
jgi:putative addiction module killer protein